MVEALVPEVVDTPQAAARKNRRSLVRYKIRRLPPEARRELEKQFAEDNFGSFADLSKWLEETYGQKINPASLQNYYKNNFDPVLTAVKIATAQAAEIVRLTAGDDGMMSGALLRLVQTAIFDLLVQLQRSRRLIEQIPKARAHSAVVANKRAERREHEGPSPEPSAALSDPSTRVEIAAVAALGKVTATVSKAVIEFERWRDELRKRVNQKVAATAIAVADVAHEAGLSPEVEKTIRDALMEIKV
jgi:hypothetical protein